MRLLGLVMALGIPAIAWIENSAFVVIAPFWQSLSCFGGIGASGASTRPLQDSRPRPHMRPGHRASTLSVAGLHRWIGARDASR